MKKFLFFGARESIETFFEKAQQKGIIEFIPDSGKKRVAVPQNVADLQTAITILNKQEIDTQTTIDPRIDLEVLAQRVIELARDEERLLDEKKALNLELVKIAPLGKFSTDEIKKLQEESKKAVQFFCIKHTSETDRNELIFIESDHEYDYYISIADEKIAHRNGWIEITVERSFDQLDQRLESAKKETIDVRQSLRDLTPYIARLKRTLITKLEEYHLKFAKEELGRHLDEVIFTVEAWIPENHVEQARALIKEFPIEMEAIKIEDNDLIPTCMENKGLAASGEDLVHIYDTPAHTDRDPSGYVLWFFAFFFGVIVSDGGYGMLYLIATLFAWWKFKVIKPSTRRFLRLATLLSTSCVIWGILTCSYFGMNISLDNPLQKVSIIRNLMEKKATYHIEMRDDVYQEWVKKDPKLINVQDPGTFLRGAKGEIVSEFGDNIMLELAIFIGVVHISLSLFRYVNRNYASIGWFIFLIGGYMFFPSILNATSIWHFLGLFTKSFGQHYGLYLVYGGVAFACVAAVIQNRLGGLGEITQVIGIFSDVLSYLRLYALGLAGMMMASTFNSLGQEMGLLKGGILVILIGHVINIGIGIMG
ncbi:MAG: V-type ATPase 116kDa subunit family protein, partial [Simkaniaceae bacterium]|nr:V-type ATPase 116kDa subunit family protein [Simkaniaceae bacterium]